MAKKGIDGNHIIYHYLQKVVASADDDFSRHTIERLIIDLSIWFPPWVYRAIPIFLPFCLRDPTCRSSGPSGSDEWGSANSEGYLRDDNSLLKALPLGLPVSSPEFTPYNKKPLAKGFVASHVWRKITIEGTEMLASRHPKLYSFIPNIAWLPVQISKLTDREGSHAQRVFQTLAHRIYGPSQQDEPTEISPLWHSLPDPALNLDVDPHSLNYFTPELKWVERRKNKLGTEIGSIQAVIGGADLAGKKVKSSRYLPSLREIAGESLLNLERWLKTYIDLAGLNHKDLSG